MDAVPRVVEPYGDPLGVFQSVHQRCALGENIIKLVRGKRPGLFRFPLLTNQLGDDLLLGQAGRGGQVGQLPILVVCETKIKCHTITVPQWYQFSTMIS